MSRRIEIELTSAKTDGSWTWRAAGAKQPRGVLIGDLLPSGAKVGDVLRVETEIGLDGIEVTSVLPPKAPHREPERIELVAKRPENFEGVITTLVPKSEKRGRERRPPRDGDARGERRPNGSRTERPSTPRPERTDRSERPSRPSRPRPEGSAVERSADDTRTPRKPTRQRPAVLVVKSVRREALISGLPAEQRPIAEQLANGGLATFRRALAEQQSQDRAAGRPVVNGEAILTLAEQLLPSVREASWLDRADAVLERLETISLRDLRSTVTGAATRTDEAKEKLTALRSALEDRLTRLRTKWEQEISHALAEGRVLQALRLSAKPPEPSTRFPAALVVPLATAAGEALNDATQPDRWLALLEAAAASPIRRSIKPTGIPADPTNAVRQAASAAAGRVPALAKLLGLAIPPPPRPSMSVKVTAAIPPPPTVAVSPPVVTKVAEAVEDTEGSEPVALASETDPATSPTAGEPSTESSLSE